jgi:formiminoglutamase
MFYLILLIFRYSGGKRMINPCYKPSNIDVWQGRIDSEDNFDAYRWHQWIEQIDLNNEELQRFDGKLGFAIIGFCCDEGVRRNRGRVGAANGPAAIRKEMSNLPCHFTKEVRLFDAGDIYCKDNDLEGSQECLASAVKRILSLNLFPIVLGGGHEVAFGHYCGIAASVKKYNNNSDIGIINFDAHFDLRPYDNGTSSGTMFKQIADLCHESGSKYSYMCIGVQKHSNTIELFKTSQRLGVEYILAKDIAYSDDFSIMERINDFIKLKDHIYITICSDVFTSAFAPGVSATQSLGMDPEKALKFIKYILRSNKVISFDIAEVSPRFDQDNTTANLAAVIIFSVVNTLAKMKDLDVEI